jgi:hypothetical protein
MNTKIELRFEMETPQRLSELEKSTLQDMCFEFLDYIVRVAKPDLMLLRELKIESES